MVIVESDDRVLLKDIQALTFQSGTSTKSRRSSPIQQLTCTGGGHCDSVQLSTVQCYNRGSDGQSIQWECKADMPNRYKFGQLDVSCEGYDSPEDEYILAGSCGLRYTIVDREALVCCFCMCRNPGSLGGACVGGILGYLCGLGDASRNRSRSPFGDRRSSRGGGFLDNSTSIGESKGSRHLVMRFSPKVQ
ncbi:Store-operated calcium entry-associated regulatory factor [Dermatophagoides pteronyssinus]|uniref:Store-operated calcium entry-associated regulatory factor n=1 Tax=Dermatophagoides pteronyssinus TaxID=6956 RepID=A0ABQ8ISJ3_DERPT|nr:Store-operated calcium entry-associated regulatory factor [Dermatophagoides pteronyssinus]